MTNQEYFELGLIVGMQITILIVITIFLLKHRQVRGWIRKDLERYDKELRNKK